VLGQVDAAHSALAQLLDDGVRPECLPHQARGGRPRTGGPTLGTGRGPSLQDRRHLPGHFGCLSRILKDGPRRSGRMWTKTGGASGLGPRASGFGPREQGLAGGEAHAITWRDSATRSWEVREPPTGMFRSGSAGT